MKKLIYVSAIALGAFVMGFNLKPTNKPNLGSFSISLAVKDIKASKAFYEKLGFEKLLKDGGNVDQNWVIMTNGKSNIGLFQGLFPANTITFNPRDARSIYKDITQHGIKETYSMGLDKEEGPCSFSILDPDGNPILVDQH